jgi:hypothetical protein
MPGTVLSPMVAADVFGSRVGAAVGAAAGAAVGAAVGVAAGATGARPVQFAGSGWSMRKAFAGVRGTSKYTTKSTSGSVPSFRAS